MTVVPSRGGRRGAPGRRRRYGRPSGGRSPSFAGTCPRRGRDPAVRLGEPQPGALEVGSPRTGPASVHTTLVSLPKMPSRLIESGAHQPVAEQVQPQPGVLRDPVAGPAGRRPRCGRRACAPADLVDALEPASSEGASRSRRVAEPRGGVPRVEHAVLALGPGVRRQAVPQAEVGRGRGGGVGHLSNATHTRPAGASAYVGDRSASSVRVAGWMGRMPPATLDLSQDVVALTEDLVNIESVSGDGSGSPTGGDGAAGLGPPRGAAVRAHRGRPQPTRVATSGW
jgi:hypothetical protein